MLYSLILYIKTLILFESGVKYKSNSSLFQIAPRYLLQYLFLKSLFLLYWLEVLPFSWIKFIYKIEPVSGLSILLKGSICLFMHNTTLFLLLRLCVCFNIWHGLSPHNVSLCRTLRAFVCLFSHINVKISLNISNFCCVYLNSIKKKLSVVWNKKFGAMVGKQSKTSLGGKWKIWSEKNVWNIKSGGQVINK